MGNMRVTRKQQFHQTMEVPFPSHPQTTFRSNCFAVLSIDFFHATKLCQSQDWPNYMWSLQENSQLLCWIHTKYHHPWPSNLHALTECCLLKFNQWVIASFILYLLNDFVQDSTASVDSWASNAVEWPVVCSCQISLSQLKEAEELMINKEKPVQLSFKLSYTDNYNECRTKGETRPSSICNQQLQSLDCSKCSQFGLRE